MTIQQVVEVLQRDKQYAVPSRFPCRAIMVTNIAQYCALLERLRKDCGARVVSTAELMDDVDVLPQYDRLQNARYKDEWLVLTGVSEYLRLFSRKEAEDGRFARIWRYQASADSTGRILIPLWGCEAQWFDPSLRLTEDLRQETFYMDCTNADAPEQEMEITVLHSSFEKYVSQLEQRGQLICGMREWFDYWCDPREANTHFVLLTRFARRMASVAGLVSIRVFNDAFSYVHERMNGAGELTRDDCTEGMFHTLFCYALQGLDLESALLNVFNVSTFHGLDVMSRWKTFSEEEKRFVALWLKLHPEHSYLCHCFRVARDIAAVEYVILHEIFAMTDAKEKWLSEYRQLLQVMSLSHDEAFFAELDKLPIYEDRIAYLFGSTREEKRYLLRMLSEWLRVDSAQALASDALQGVYPALDAYLHGNSPALDADLRAYLQRYVVHKLGNTLPKDDALHFGAVHPSDYDYRFSLLTEYADADTAVLWIDALGVEWLPLLAWSLQQHVNGKIQKCAVAQAALPTETCYNNQWSEAQYPYRKLDKLDKLAHTGVVDDPDYFACIEEQLAFVTGICNEVNAWLTKYHRVIVTGDHGVSRLAARMFHAREGREAPKDAKVCSHGRYCKLSTDVGVVQPGMRLVKHPDGSKFAVLENYDHFKQSGFAAGVDDENAIFGEVHGGATPEEMLVPVFVIDSTSEIPLHATWKQTKVKLMRKQATLSICFNKPIQQLSVTVANLEGITTPNENGTQWQVVVAGLTQGVYEAVVVADHQIVALPALTVLSALGEGMEDLL